MLLGQLSRSTVPRSSERKRLYWPFPDPSAATRSLEEKFATIRPIGVQIKETVRTFVAEELGISTAGCS